MKVAIYIRVSTSEQVQEGYSIQAQRDRLEAYAKSQGWEIVYYYVDEGISAKDMNRPELKRMLKGIEEGIFNIVLVYKLDRLTRSILDLYKLLETFEKHGVKFKSATEVYDTTTAIGRLFITLVAALAQWERENLGERVSFGMEQKAREGKWTVSIPPLGYDSVGDSELQINQQESIIVKEIFSLYIAGNGMWKIAKNLNDRGLYTKGGKPWGQNTIDYILTNPIYKGTTRYNFRVNKENYFEIDGVAPPIVTEEEFNYVQQLVQSRRHIHPRQATSKYLFSKVLKCARCGSTLIGKSSSTKRGMKKYTSYNYFCPQKRKSLCDLPTINQSFVETLFIKILEKWDGSQYVKDSIQNETTASKEDIEEKANRLKNELAKIEKRRSKWQYAWADDAMPYKDYQNRMKEEAEKEKMILKELEELTPIESVKVDNKHNISILSDLKRHWNEMDDQTKKQFILIAVDFMVVDKIGKDKDPKSIKIKEINLR